MEPAHGREVLLKTLGGLDLLNPALKGLYGCCKVIDAGAVPVALMPARFSW